MSKLKLDLDDLAVETFDTIRAAKAKQDGTVHANADTEWHTCAGRTCDPGNTCWDSCDGVCGTYFCATAGDSCGQASCVYTCTTCNPYGCATCGTCQLC